MKTEDTGEQPLNGWKAIAAYLGKSTRAAQRWEQDLAMPVHRLHTPTGQVVYAHRQEIDKWRAALDPRDTADTDTAEPPGSVASDDVVDGTPGVSPRPGPHAAWRIGMAWGCAAVAVAAIAYWILGFGRGTVSSVLLKEDALAAVDARGFTVWEHQLGWTPERTGHGATNAPTEFVSADIDGDGANDTLVAIRQPASGTDPQRDAVFCFSPSGTLRWSYAPMVTMSFAGRRFEGPWRVFAMTVSTTAGRQRVFVSYGHHTWWPSFVVELTAGGEAEPKYFQSGSIWSLRAWSHAGSEYLVAAGVTNGYGRASVAVLDANASPSTVPQDRLPQEYRCDDCPRAGPAFFALLPRTEIANATGSVYNRVVQLDRVGQDYSLTTVEDVMDSASGATYVLGRDLLFRDAALNSHYWARHDELQRERLIDHPASTCVEARKPHAISTWKPGSGWQDLSISFENAKR